jgi:hypothetical protein
MLLVIGLFTNMDSEVTLKNFCLVYVIGELKSTLYNPNPHHNAKQMKTFKNHLSGSTLTTNLTISNTFLQQLPDDNPTVKTCSNKQKLIQSH